MLIHPDLPFRDAHERHSERTIATSRRHRRSSQLRPIASPTPWTDVLVPFRRIAAALF